LILGYLVALQTLNLSDCELVSDGGLCEIAHACTSLEDLNVKACSQLTNKSVELLFDQTSSRKVSIRSLNVGLCHKLTDSCVQKISAFCRAKKNESYLGLHTLKLSGCFSITDSALKTFSADAGDKGTHLSLRLLCLSGCYQISGPAVQHLSLLLPTLESINLYSCSSVDDAALESIARNCPHLASLVISKCPITDIGAVALANNCPNLHTLYMSFLAPGKVDFGPSDTLKPRNRPLSTSRLTDAGVSELLTKCKELKLFDLSRCEMLTDAAFETSGSLDVVDENQMSFGSASMIQLSLQVLMVRVCPRLSYGGLRKLIARCPRLQNLDVVGCPGLSAAERDSLFSLLNAM
jgi:hypothetical protein